MGMGADDSEQRSRAGENAGDGQDQTEESGCLRSSESVVNTHHKRKQPNDPGDCG
jgi:hypothetical protein